MHKFYYKTTFLFRAGVFVLKQAKDCFQYKKLNISTFWHCFILFVIRQSFLKIQTQIFACKKIFGMRKFYYKITFLFRAVVFVLKQAKDCFQYGKLKISTFWHCFILFVVRQSFLKLKTQFFACKEIIGVRHFFYKTTFLFRAVIFVLN